MALKAYIAKRIAIALITVYIVATLNFVIFVVHPGDPVRYLLDPEMTEEQKYRIKLEYGYFDPWHVRYLKYLRNLLSFGLIPPYFGISLVKHTYVASEMAWRLPLTVGLLGLALIGTILLGLPVGILAASKRGKKFDVAIMGVGLFTYGVPTFFIQLIALLFLVTYLRQTYGILLFPSGGWISYPRPQGLFSVLLNILWHFTLPVLTLIVAAFAGWALYTRNMLLDSLTQDYVLTARAKGLSERSVLFKHALKSIYPPIATLITLSIPGLATGAIITEQVFGLQGIGQWYINSISLVQPDYPVVEAVLFIYAVLVIVCNLIADLMYGVLDPRIRVGARR
ncbi:MAG: ABC transporter permease [Asgard group archaeon]